MKNGLPLRFTGRMAALLLSAWLLSGAAWAQSYVAQTGTANPFDGVNPIFFGNPNGNPSPTLKDLDGDGDRDALIGGLNGTLLYFKNTGTASAPVFVMQTSTANPFNGVDLGLITAPDLSDLDGDGDLDAVVGTNAGTLSYFKNTGTASAPTFAQQTGTANPFNGILYNNMPNNTSIAPSLGDLDGDGDLDMLLGDKDGRLDYFKNTGTASAPVFALQTGATNDPVNGQDVGLYAVPCLGDVDGDGDLDFVVGNGDGVVVYYKNTGTKLAPVFAQQFGTDNPFDGIDVGLLSTPALGDLTGDGKLDLIVGNYTPGSLFYFKYTPAPPQVQTPNPATQTVCVGGSAGSTVSATGTGTLAYAWFRNQADGDEPVAGQTSATLSLSNVQSGGAGSYYCRVTGEGGSTWSTAFVLTVNALPTATAPTLGASAICKGGSTTVSATFGGAATGGSFSDGAAGGAFSNVSTNGNTVSATYTPAASFSGQATIAFSTNDPDGPCPAATSTATLAVNAPPAVTNTVVSPNPICQGGFAVVSARFGGEATAANFSDGGAGGTFTNVAYFEQSGGTQARYTPASSFTGTVTITFTTNDPDGSGGCPVATATRTLDVRVPPTASAITLGASTICQSSTTTVSATFGGGASSGSFDDGDEGGTFSDVTTNGNTVTATYAPRRLTTASETIRINFSTNDPDGGGGCEAAKSWTVLTVNRPMQVSGISADAALCQGEPTNLTVSSSGTASALDGSFSDGGVGGSFQSKGGNGINLSFEYTPASAFTGALTFTFTSTDPDGSGPCPAVTATKGATVNPAATVTAPSLGADAICKGGNTTVSATFGGAATSGSFSDGSAGGAFANVTTTGNTVSATYTPAASFSGQVTISFSSNNPDGPCDAVSAATTLTVRPSATASAPVLGASTICQGSATSVSATFGGSATGGTFSDGGAGGAFTNLTTSGSTVTATYTPLATFTGSAFLVFTATGPCQAVASDPNQAKLTVNAAATLSAVTTLTDLGYTTAFCQGSLTVVTATFGGSATGGEYSDGGVGGEFTNILLLGPDQKTKQATYTPPSEFTGPITITFTTHDPDGPCPALSATLNLTVNPSPTASAITLGTSTLCQGSSTTVSASFGGGASSGTFSDGGKGGAFSNVSATGNTVSATYTPAASFSGEVTLTFTTNDPDGAGSCAAATSTGSLTVNLAATATAPSLGASAICQGGNTTLSVGFGGAATGGTFSDGGAGGAFSNVSTTGSTVSATYTPASGFSGTVTITFTTNDPDGVCPAAATTAGLTVNPLPILASATASPNPVCEGSPLSLEATASGGGGAFKYGWSGPNGFNPDPTTANPLTRPDATAQFAGTYSVTVTDANGCTASGQTAAVGVVQPTGLPQPTHSVGAAVCAGQDLTVSFTVVGCGFAPGTLTAQLSDKAGSFAAPAATWPVSPGSTTVALPPGLASGTEYRIRLVSSYPVLTGEASGAFKINALVVAPAPSTPGRACQGDRLAVSFATGSGCAFPAGNVFTVQLSSATGSFGNPTVLGTAPVGTTDFALPANLPVGTGYRVRVVSSLPATTSVASAPFQLVGPSLSVTPTLSGAPVCRGSAATVSFSLPAGNCAFPNGNGFTAQLSSATGSFNNPTNLGAVVPGQASSVAIPASVSAGSGYRIRVVSSSPALTSSNSALFQVKACTNRLSAEEPTLVVAPNPVVGSEIRCRVTGLDNPAFTLTTTTGRSVNVSAKNDGSGEFVLTPQQALGSGVYLLQASAGNRRLAQRVLVTE